MASMFEGKTIKFFLLGDMKSLVMQKNALFVPLNNAAIKPPCLQYIFDFPVQYRTSISALYAVSCFWVWMEQENRTTVSKAKKLEPWDK